MKKALVAVGAVSLVIAGFLLHPITGFATAGVILILVALMIGGDW